MPQQELSSSQELTAGGGGNTGGGSFTTGAKCLSSGTFVTENKYLRQVIALGKDEEFPPDMSGKKCTWTALSTAVAGSKTADGGFTTVKVAPGVI
jgi:hypothetical protein